MLYCTVVCRIKLIKRGRDYMNNKKKLLSIITALAITASAFTGFAVTASAENTDEQPISADSEITLADETTSTEVVTEDEQSEAVELADDSDVYFEQNYDAADASVDWVSPNMQSAITLVDDGNGGKMVDTTHLDNMVGSIASRLLVSSIIIPYSGGSSIVFSKAFWACSFIFSASSTI